MSSYFTTVRTDLIGAVTLTGTTAVVFATGIPVDVQHLNFVVSTAITAASTINVAVRNVDDSSSRAIGTIVLPITAINKVVRVGIVRPKEAETIAADGSKAYSGYNPGGPVLVNPGEELVLTPAANGAAGVVQAYAEYYEQGFSGSRVDGTVAGTFTPA
jgi:hypothetical protein